ncbi:MAG: ASCH domain-containing protein [Bacilli bacterium]|nr:ASCH domain-containing protein [Bacilli bacterium]
MIYVMKLKKQYFNYIKYGTKEYEIRLNDEKRKNIKSGDFIEFQKDPSLEEKVLIMVDDILYYNNFNELFDNINIDYLADSSITKKQLKLDLEKFYPVEKQKKYGVVAIKLNKDIIINNTNINNISYNEKIFDKLKNNYDSFNHWFNKMKSNNIDVYYTKKDNILTSIMILKHDETDSQQFLEKGNILKIRTLLVNDKNKGIGKMYLSIIDNIAICNNVDYIYLTIKNDNKELISFIKKNGYQKYNHYNDEFVYYKELK